MTTIGEAPYLAAGDWAVDAPVVAFNPSYFSPYAYHIFAEVDPDHNWQALIDGGYRVLFDSLIAPLRGGLPAGLPPDWVGLDRADGALTALDLARGDTALYGYDASRTYWRVALDLRWTGDGRAAAFLRQAGFLRDEVERKGYASAVYAHDGTVVEQAPSMVATAGALAALLTLAPDAANGLYDSQIVGAVTRVNHAAHWGDPSDLYGQEWGWFATAFYAGALPDLWHAR